MWDRKEREGAEYLMVITKAESDFGALLSGSNLDWRTHAEIYISR